MAKRRACTIAAATACCLAFTNTNAVSASPTIRGAQSPQHSSSSSASQSATAQEQQQHQQQRRASSRARNEARPPIQDERQADKIREFNESRSRGRRSQEASSSSSRSIQQLTIEELHSQSPSDQTRHLQKLVETRRRLYDISYMHSKKSNYGSVSVQAGNDLGFQSAPVVTVSATTSSTTAASNTDSILTTYTEPPSNSFPYYPLWSSTLTSGTCTNNGLQPHGGNNFVYTTLWECCHEWFYDVEGCLVGLAEATGNSYFGGGLLVRDKNNGSLLDEKNFGGTPPLPEQMNAAASASYFPSFDMALHPNGACLSSLTSTPPSSYLLTSQDYLFDSVEACCNDWFINVELCLGASTGGSVSSPMASPSSTSYPTWDLENDSGTAWPTWSDDVFQHAQDNQQGDQDDDEEEEPSSYSFYESFEMGDFSSYPWKLSASSPSTDSWEADQTALAYDGNYAARPGILSEEGSATNLTISLDGIQHDGSSFRGGLLTFAIHASVAMPVDALYFSINDHVLRTFDSVTGDSGGDWEEVSTLLLPGEHTLTWSYHYYGMPSDMSGVDPRRDGNSWVDAVALLPFTGDYSFPDLDTTSLLDVDDGMAPWTLVTDPNAYDGGHSYIAYSQDIVSNQGSADMSWTIVAGPDGGFVSFSAFASIYAPHDILEFSVDGLPVVAITMPSYQWEEHVVDVEAGKHVLSWRLVKNQPGLSASVIEGVDVPGGYQGYVKVDAIKYEDHLFEEDVGYASAEVQTTPVATTSQVVSTTSSTGFWTTSETTEALVVSSSTSSAFVSTTTEVPTTSSAFVSTTTKVPATSSAFVSTTTETPEYSSSSSTVVASDGSCPEGLKAVEGLPGCCVAEPNYLGDGACDPYEPYNTEACGYDLGDCCHDSCNEDSPYGCHTREGADYGPFGFFCLDPRAGSTIDASKCLVENREWIGDGGCDGGSEYNTAECGWDGGDCCEDSCDQDFAFYTCGANQPFECLMVEVDEPPVTTVSASTTEAPKTTEVSPTGAVLGDLVAARSNPVALRDGFEAGVFDPLMWNWMDGDANWETDDDVDAAEGKWFAEARTGDIIDDMGTAVLALKVKSPNGGKLAFQIQALIQSPHEDLIIEVDDKPVSFIINTIDQWKKEEVDILEGGEHIIKWVHRKNPTNQDEGALSKVAKNEGISRIDDVTFTPF
eukprot:scaffold1868_cov194-Alexandrium_tamarense.AAC.23